MDSACWLESEGVFSAANNASNVHLDGLRMHGKGHDSISESSCVFRALTHSHMQWTAQRENFSLSLSLSLSLSFLPFYPFSVWSSI